MRLPCTYTAIAPFNSMSHTTIQVRCSSEQLLHIENLIHTGISDVLHSYNNIDYRIPETFKFAARAANSF